MSDNDYCVDDDSSLLVRGGDGADEPLLVGGSTGRPRPRTFTFLEFIAIPAGPTTLPLSSRTIGGTLGVVTVLSFLAFLPILLGSLREGPNPVFFFLSPGLFMAVLPLAYWKYFQSHGPLATLQSHIRLCTMIYGKHSRFVAMALFRLGMYYESQNEPEKALVYYQQITDFPICTRHHGAAPYYSKIGKLFYTLGRYEEALEAFEMSLTLRRKLEKALFVLRLQEILHCIGQTHERLGHLDEALKVFQEAHGALVQRGHDRSIESAKSLTFMARVLASKDELDQSLETYQQALEIYVYNVGEFPRRKSVGDLYKAIGDLRAKKGEGSLAAENYGLAVEVFRRGGKSDEDKEMQGMLRKIEDLKAVGEGQKV